MKKGSRGIIERTLSGMGLMGLMMLGLFVPKAFSYSDVYRVKPTTAGNSGYANAVWETFSATCDSIDSVTYFVGAEATDTTANYLVSITDSATSQEVWSSSRSARGWKYQDMGFGVHKPVVRGKTYYLRMSISAQYQQMWNYFYDNTGPYLWGQMGTATLALPQKDLAAWVGGTNRTDSTYWGVSSEANYGTSATKDSLLSRAKDTLGMNVIREQQEWRGLDSTTASSPGLDQVAFKARNKGLRILLDFFGTPKWASNMPLDALHDTSEAWKYPPRNLTCPFGNSPTDSNFLWKFAYRLAKHYSADSFRVHDYEIWNETNYYDWWRYGQRGDTLDNRYYNTSDFPLNASGRAKLYVLACSVACDAIRYGDPQARIYTNAVLHMNVPSGYNTSGKEWMQDYYEHGGKKYGDVITWHWYQGYEESYHRFYPGRFIADYDTLRRIMRDNGDRAKPVWADEGGYGTPSVIRVDSMWTVKREKQADIVLQGFVTGLGQRENGLGPALEQVTWHKLYDREDWTAPEFWAFYCGVQNQRDSGFAFKPSAYAYKQMTGKLKDKYFNRRVPLGNPSDSVYCFEFQIPGSDTMPKTWAIWRSGPYLPLFQESLAIRTTQYDSLAIDYNGNPRSTRMTVTNPSGRINILWVDSVPQYISEVAPLSRPDIIVDSLWIYPTNPDPRAGEGVWFYARLKNIGNAALSSSIWNSVTFQVDGVSKKTYQIQRTLNIGDTVTLGASPPGGGASDWQATWGDHLIRAWADSADRYVELREDNNTKYLWKHFQPKVSVVINNDHKYTNHLNSDTVSIAINGGTLPNPDSVKFWHESGSWTKVNHNTSFDTLVSYSGNGTKFDSARVYQGGDLASGGDSIIVDASSPFVDITSPTQGQTVSGNVPFWGWSWDYEDHDSLWEIYVNGSPWVSGNNKVGENPMFGMPGQFGTWDSRTVPNGWRWHQLRSTDAATNLAKDSVKVKVSNHQTNSGDSWASNFGTLPSAPMNVATDPAGNVYFAETQNSKIRKYSPRKDSLFAFSAKRGNDSTGLNWAVSMILKDSTTIYIADGYAHAIKAFDRQGNLLLRFGSFGTNAGQFRQPCGIALDHKGRLFVVDRLNHRVQVFSDSSGGFLFQFGSQGRDSGKMDSPTGIAITPNGLVYVSDTRNNQLQVFDSLGNYLKTIKTVDSLGLDTPLGICSDKYGDIFVADARHNRIVELNPYGERIFDFGGQGDSLWQFRTPVGVASSPGAHYLYVADAGNRRVQKFIVIEEDTTGGGPQGGAGVQVLPLVYELGPAIPNPSKGQTTFRYALPKESRVNFTIYNVTGQVVKEFNQGKQKAGYYSITWDGRSNLGHRVGAGVYFYRLQAGNWAKTRKMVVIR
jgi:hypothetical protein